MATNRHLTHSGALRRTLGIAALCGLALIACSTAAAESSPFNPSSTCSPGRTLLSASTSSLSPLKVTRVRAVRTVARTGGYDWPIKPFDRQHPIRGFFNDPRIGDHGGQAFHFGVDIAAPDGTAVYAVEAGTVYFDNAEAIAVVSLDRSHEFGYWHIVPVAKSHQLVRRHQLLGHIARGWGHVHFAEHRAGKYLNPLRPGALTPYVDRTPPSIDEVAVVELGRGSFGLIASAHDMPDPQVPGAWADEPVTPALLQWRIVRDGATGGAWKTAADFRSTMLPASEFKNVYAPATRQNHKGVSGLFCFYLAHAWSTAGLPGGGYRLQVSATDTQGNRALAELLLTVANGAVQA
jgi:Peptidase family M23